MLMYESFNEVDSICRKYGINNYTINKDGLVDVNGSVIIEKYKLERIPLKFGKVSGDFSCKVNKLTSIDGCPYEVGGSFYCGANELTNIEGMPVKIGGSFYCGMNKKLTTLKGSDVYLGKDFHCGYNNLTTIEGCPRYIDGNFSCGNNYLTNLKGSPIRVNGYFDCTDNQLTSFEGCPRYVVGVFSCIGNPVYEVYKLIRDIVNKDYFNLIEFQENWNPIREDNIIILDRLNDYLETFGAEPVTSVEGYKCI